mgnify:FL=1
MKLKKRIMACVVAAAVVVTSAVTAMAAGSIDKNGKADGYKVEVVKEETPAYQEIKKTYEILPPAIVAVNKGTYKMKDFIADMSKEAAQNANLTEAAKENLTQVAEKLEGTEFVTAFYSLTEDENSNVKIEKEDGKYKVTLTVENLTKDLTGLKVLAYNSVKGEWEIVEIPADAIDVENHTVTITLEDISLFSIISDDPAAAK